MEDRFDGEDWSHIGRMASQKTQNSKGPQLENLESPPTPSLLKDDVAPFVVGPENEGLVWHSPGPYVPNRQDPRPNASFSGISTPLLFALAIYSTILSGIWFLIAVIKPHYGMFISAIGGTVAPSTASTIVAGVAKTIELTFVTVFLACLGQFFTKQAFNSGSPGISLADIQLKTMIVQPGTLMTQWRSYSLVWRSMLGLLSLLACVTAIFYTTASDALVSPVPSLHPAVLTSLVGKVQASIGNLYYVENNCPSPITLTEDPIYKGSTCVALDFAGTAYHNYMAFMSNWTSTASGGNVSMANRPPPTAMLSDNVTVTGSWVEPVSVYSKENRIISNVSMAIPHGGVVAASTLQNNNLLSAQTTSSDELDIDAQTVVPVMNVLCASANATDLGPMIYSNFTNQNASVNATSWPDPFNSTGWYNTTVFDDIFGFTPSRPPPLFFALPVIYNTMLNGSGNRPDALYILMNSNTTLHQTNNNQQFTLCSMSMALRSGCSTKLHSTLSGSMLTSDCSADNPMGYVPTPANNASTWDRHRDWVSVLAEWAYSVSINAGIVSTNASTERAITQFAPRSPSVDATRPSLPEALAVLAANTLLSATVDGPFDGQFPYEENTAPEGILPNATLLPFTASVRVSDYASGGSQSWQNIFVLILIPVFALNCLCLAYLLYICLPDNWFPQHRHLHRRSAPQYPGYSSIAHPYLHSGVQRDFTDIQNLFVLALNSAEPREGSLMRETGGTWPRPVPGTDYSPSPANMPGARTWFLQNRGPSLQGEREERHRVLGTKWHIQPKPPSHPPPPPPAGLGLGVNDSGASIDETNLTALPYFSPSSSAPPPQPAGGASAFHIVVDGEQQQHHFRRRRHTPGQQPRGYRERVRGKFEKYLSPSSIGGHSRGSSVESADDGQGFMMRSRSGFGRRDTDGGLSAGADKETGKARHISGPYDVKNSVGIDPTPGSASLGGAISEDGDERDERGKPRDAEGEEGDLGNWQSPRDNSFDYGDDNGARRGGGNGAGSQSHSRTTRHGGEEYEFVELRGPPGTPTTRDSF